MNTVIGIILMVAPFAIAAIIFKEGLELLTNSPAKRDYIFDSIYLLGHYYLREKSKITQVQMALRFQYDTVESKIIRHELWEKYKILGVKALDNRLVKIMKDLDVSNLNKGIVLSLFAKHVRDSKYFDITIPKNSEYGVELNSYVDFLASFLFQTQTLLDNPSLSLADLVILKEEFKIDEVPIILAAIKQYLNSRL